MIYGLLAALSYQAKYICNSASMRKTPVADRATSQASDTHNGAKDALLQEISRLLSSDHIHESIKLLRASHAVSIGGKEKRNHRPGPACFRAVMQRLAWSRAPQKLFDQLVDELRVSDLPTDSLTECCCVRYLCRSPVEGIDYTLELYDSMLRMGIQPDIVTLECLVAACLRARRPATAKDLILGLDDLGLSPSAALYASLITAFGMIGDVERGIGVLTQMRNSMGHNCDALRLGFIAAVTCCAQNQDLEQALALLAEGSQLRIQWGANLLLPLLVAAVQNNEVRLASEVAAQACNAGIAGCGSDIARACQLLFEQSPRNSAASRALKVITATAASCANNGILIEETQSTTKKFTPDALAMFLMHTF